MAPTAGMRITLLPGVTKESDTTWSLVHSLPFSQLRRCKQTITQWTPSNLYPWNVSGHFEKSLLKIQQVPPWNEATPLIRTLWLVPRVAGLEGVHRNWVYIPHSTMCYLSNHSTSSPQIITQTTPPTTLKAWVKGFKKVFKILLHFALRLPGPYTSANRTYTHRFKYVTEAEKLKSGF